MNLVKVTSRPAEIKNDLEIKPTHITLKLGKGREVCQFSFNGGSMQVNNSDNEFDDVIAPELVGLVAALNGLIKVKYEDEGATAEIIEEVAAVKEIELTK